MKKKTVSFGDIILEMRDLIRAIERDTKKRERCMHRVAKKAKRLAAKSRKRAK
jgi:hypothetical protein